MKIRKIGCNMDRRVGISVPDGIGQCHGYVVTSNGVLLLGGKGYACSLLAVIAGDSNMPLFRAYLTSDLCPTCARGVLHEVGCGKGLGFHHPIHPDFLIRKEALEM